MVYDLWFILSATADCSSDFAVALIKGDAVTLQDPHSDVSVDIPAGIKGILRWKIHFEFSRFLHIVPDDECFIGPVVELHLKPFPEEESEKERSSVKVPTENVKEEVPFGKLENRQDSEDKCFVRPFVEIHVEETGQHRYRIKIPHCLKTEEERSSVKIRSGDVQKRVEFQELKNKQKASGKIPFYEVDEHHIIIYTNHFTEYICSSCSKTCLSYTMAFPFGTILPGEDGDHTKIKVEVYLCCSLYNIEDFKTVSFYYKDSLLILN